MPFLEAALCSLIFISAASKPPASAENTILMLISLVASIVVSAEIAPTRMQSRICLLIPLLLLQLIFSLYILLGNSKLG